MNPLPLPHNQIPKTCTCKWIPVGNGLWERTNEMLEGLPECTFDHLRAQLEAMNVADLRALAREMGLSSTTRLHKHSELVKAIAKVMADKQAESPKR